MISRAFLVALCFSLLGSSGALCGAPIDRAHHLQHDLDEAPRTESTLQARLAAIDETPADCGLMFQLALDFLSLVDTDHWHYLDNARDYLEKVLTDHPEDPLVTMYLGRAIGAKALNLGPSTLKRLQWAREGFRLMDEAVRRAPDDIYLRLLRAESQLLAHPILRRKRTLDKDAEALNGFLTSPALRDQPALFQARLHLFLGDYLGKKKKSEAAARTHWASAVQLASGTSIAGEARARMDGTWQNPGYEGE